VHACFKNACKKEKPRVRTHFRLSCKRQPKKDAAQLKPAGQGRAFLPLAGRNLHLDVLIVAQATPAPVGGGGVRGRGGEREQQHKSRSGHRAAGGQGRRHCPLLFLGTEQREKEEVDARAHACLRRLVRLL
jgi:hypothetical protein